MQIRVFNYNTLERVHMFEAHSDYIRCIAVHPTQPYILTSSGRLLTKIHDRLLLCVFWCTWGWLCFCVCADDMLIKLWDWEKKWTCSQVFEGHTHYVMQIVINPKDNNQFASASLDRTIKVGVSQRASCHICCHCSRVSNLCFMLIMTSNAYLKCFWSIWCKHNCTNQISFWGGACRPPNSHLDRLGGFSFDFNKTRDLQDNSKFCMNA